jgi:acyl-coenzyme A thioesterase PaaI-like protein
VATPLHVGRTTVVIEVRIERVRDGESKLAANLIVTQFVLAPREP